MTWPLWFLGIWAAFSVGCGATVFTWMGWDKISWKIVRIYLYAVIGFGVCYFVMITVLVNLGTAMGAR